MVYGIVKWVIISLILIMLIHHIFDFLKSNMTVPKVKELTQNSSKLYKEVDDIIESNKSNTNLNNNEMKDEMKYEMKDEMKDELKNFFDELKHNIPGNIPSIDTSSTKIYTEL
jgi:hypothetical protein